MDVNLDRQEDPGFQSSRGPLRKKFDWSQEHVWVFLSI